jgi:hypothetical protein
VQLPPGRPQVVHFQVVQFLASFQAVQRPAHRQDGVRRKVLRQAVHPDPQVGALRQDHLPALRRLMDHHRGSSRRTDHRPVPQLVRPLGALRLPRRQAHPIQGDNRRHRHFQADPDRVLASTARLRLTDPQADPDFLRQARSVRRPFRALLVRADLLALRRRRLRSIASALPRG